MLQGLELGERKFAQGLGLANQRHHLVFPLRDQALPVGVVIEGALLKLLCATRNLGRIGYGVAANIDASVDDPVVDA